MNQSLVKGKWSLLKMLTVNLTIQNLYAASVTIKGV